MELGEFFRQNPRAALGFSGGVDSSYLLYAAVQAGARVQPYFIKTAFQPQFELDDAKKLCAQLGVRLRVLELDALKSPGVAANPADRCYFCKTALFGALQKAGILSVARGTGGAILLRSPEEITVWDVYAALESDEKHELLGMHPNPSPQCPVGSRIRSVLQEPYDEIFTAMQKKMQEITLQDLLDRWKEQAGGSFPPVL